MGKLKDICAELMHDRKFRAGYEELRNLLRKRRLFRALSEGLDELAAERAGKIRLRKVTVEAPDAIAIALRRSRP